jgi:hypothetical protein
MAPVIIECYFSKFLNFKIVNNDINMNNYNIILNYTHYFSIIMLKPNTCISERIGYIISDPYPLYLFENNEFIKIEKNKFKEKLLV